MTAKTTPKATLPLTEPAAAGSCNTVLLRGRVSAVEETRVMPSGDELRTLRLVVPRVPVKGRKATVDTIDIACWTAATRRIAGRLGPGDEVAVTGSLHRRFFRTPAGAASRYEVEAAEIRQVSAPPGE